MTTVKDEPSHTMFGRKLVQWHREVNHFIQVNNVKIGQNGEKMRNEYINLVDIVRNQFDIAVSLKSELAAIPTLSKEIDSIEKSIDVVCDKIGKLNTFLDELLTQQHQANMMHERNQQQFYVMKNTKNLNKNTNKKKRNYKKCIDLKNCPKLSEGKILNASRNE